MQQTMQYTMIYPMFALVLWTLCIILRLFLGRLAAVKARQVSIDHYATYQGVEPDHTLKMSRNFSNLFEAPVLFYVACLSCLVVGLSDAVALALAWGYVIARMVHSVIHIGPNVINWRIAAYFLSWVLLVSFWSYLVWHIAAA